MPLWHMHMAPSEGVYEWAHSRVTHLLLMLHGCHASRGCLAHITPTSKQWQQWNALACLRPSLIQWCTVDTSFQQQTIDVETGYLRMHGAGSVECTVCAAGKVGYKQLCTCYSACCCVWHLQLEYAAAMSSLERARIMLEAKDRHSDDISRDIELAGLEKEKILGDQAGIALATQVAMAAIHSYIAVTLHAQVWLAHVPPINLAHTGDCPA